MKLHGFVACFGLAAAGKKFVQPAFSKITRETSLRRRVSGAWYLLIVSM